MHVVRTKGYKKDYAKLPEKDQLAVERTMYAFQNNPYEQRLRNHALKGPLAGLRSIDAKGDLRILFTEDSHGRYELVTLLRVGSHAKLYE
jgi:addiction module RelE/StbE family toxin